MLNLSYNPRFDLLLLVISDSKNAVGVDEYEGVVVMRDRDDRTVARIMIYDFMKKRNAQSIPVMPDGIEIDFDNDVIPHISHLHGGLATMPRAGSIS